MERPTETLILRFDLLSAATFGRGDGVPGLVDREVEQDRNGLPFLRGRTLRGLLAEEMESLLYALGEKKKDWERSRDRLLGVEARMIDETGILHVGDGCLPDGIRRLIAVTLDENKLGSADVLESLTAIRRQTAMTAFGAPESASLRSMRVVLRGTIFASQLVFDEVPTEFDKALLAATALAWRRAGTGRNRGRGRLRAWIQDDQWMRKQFEFFRREATR